MYMYRCILGIINLVVCHTIYVRSYSYNYLKTAVQRLPHGLLAPSQYFSWIRKKIMVESGKPYSNIPGQQVVSREYALNLPGTPPGCTYIYKYIYLCLASTILVSSSGSVFSTTVAISPVRVIRCSVLVGVVNALSAMASYSLRNLQEGKSALGQSNVSTAECVLFIKVSSFQRFHCISKCTCTYMYILHVQRTCMYM